MKVLVYGSPRSGTTYLTNLLVVYTNGNRTYAEPINKRNLPTTIDETDIYLNDLVNELSTNPDYVLKMHAMPMDDLEDYYIDNDKVTDFFDRFNLIPDYSIAVIRLNLFHVALSLAYSNVTNTWIHPYPTDQVEIPLDMFKNQCYVAYRSQYLTLQNNYNIQFNELVVYEDLFKHTTAEERFSSLKLAQQFTLHDFESRHDMMTNRMTKSPDKKDVITNYDELEQVCLDYFNNIESNCFITMNGYNIVDFNDRNLFYYD